MFPYTVKISYVREPLAFSRHVFFNMGCLGGGLHRNGPWSLSFQTLVAFPLPIFFCNAFQSEGDCEMLWKDLTVLCCFMTYPQDLKFKFNPQIICSFITEIGSNLKFDYS